MREGPFWTEKWIQEQRKLWKNSNSREHHNYKKSEECIFKDFKIVLHPFDADQNQKEITR